MKGIFKVLMFAAVFGMLICSVGAADLHPYDFDGKFTMDVPSDDFDRHPVGTNTFNDKSNNYKVEYYTIDEIHGMNCNSFDEYIDECMRLPEVETDGDLTVFQDDEDYVITLYSDDVLVIITGENLEEIKTIAETADFGQESDDGSDSANETVELESHDFDDFKMDVPVGCEFEKTTDLEDLYDNGVIYTDSVNGVNITYADDNQIDDGYINELLDGFEEDGAEVSGNGNFYLIKAEPYTQLLFNNGTHMILIVSSELDEDTITAMAQSVEFDK